MGISVQGIGTAIKNTGLYREASGIKTAFKSGLKHAQMKNQPAIKGIVKGAKQVYKKTGLLPVLTGASAFASLPVPGATVSGTVAGIYLKKGIKALLKVIIR